MYSNLGMILEIEKILAWSEQPYLFEKNAMENMWKQLYKILLEGLESYISQTRLIHDWLYLDEAKAKQLSQMLK